MYIYIYIYIYNSGALAGVREGLGGVVDALDFRCA